uniref:zinc finger protein 846-like isoform X2 n=1 Tax=Myxine glutinosa TaxID=7769 RepID=UPI00358E66D3
MLCFLCLCSIGSLVHVTNAEVMEGFEILKIKIEDVNYLGPEEERGKKEDDLFVNLKVKTEQDIDENLDIPQTKAFHNQSNRQYEEILAKVKTEPDTFVDTEVQETKVYPNIKLESDHCQGEPQNARNIPCARCCLKFATEAALQLHVKRHHEIFIDKMYKCSHCPYSTYFNERFNVHFGTHNGKTKRKTRKKRGGWAVLQSSTSQQHVETYINKRQYKCKKCLKLFDSSLHLKKHLNVHRKRLCKCTTCGKSFIRSLNLKLHMRIHSAERRYTCTYCEKCFFYSSELKTHVKIHTGKRTKKCTICEKCFIYSSELKIHMRTHTDERPYKCSTCGKYFRRQSHLKTHMNVHSRERPHQCTVCGKTFSRLFSCRTHMVAHSRGKI